MKNKAKLYMIFGISLLVIAIIGSTFAYYVWNTSSDDETKIVTSIGAATVYFDGGSSMEGVSLRPVESKDYGIIKDIKVKANTTGLSFNMYLDITSLDTNLKEESFRYQFYKGTTLVKEGNFSTDYLTNNTTTCTTNNTNHITLLSDESISTSEIIYKLYIWIDGENYENPITMMNNTFSFKLHAEGTGAILKEGKIPDITLLPEDQKKTFAYKILSDYYYADKYDVINNDVIYHYDTMNKLMSDIDGNVRYYGAEPSNYIYFNCDDYSNQTSDTCETWRIIGVFDGKVKIMRNESIGNLAWDYDKNIDLSVSTYDNDWSTASLQVLLNQKYYNGDTAGTVTYYSGPDGSIVASLDMSSLGIKNNATRNLISDTLYYLGGWKKTSVYSDQIYEYERGTTVYEGRPTTWTGKIALPYPSDYGYAADLGSCTLTLNSYNDSTCTSTNWMSSIFTSHGWLLTPQSNSSETVFFLHPHYLYNYPGTLHTRGVAPVLYLGSEHEIESGTGTSSDPYRLSVS